MMVDTAMVGTGLIKESISTRLMTLQMDVVVDLKNLKSLLEIILTGSMLTFGVMANLETTGLGQVINLQKKFMIKDGV